ncbi:hypothetical protein AMR42_08305 [Limnothrix sp. PR1529]|nr:hypothetical protein BCR12_09560 [Limnothrix sp. P13C2]PIB13871.1 hypothetical protein AMR42_08305 [Limnothrix sp. PR1529]
MANFGNEPFQGRLLEGGGFGGSIAPSQPTTQIIEGLQGNEGGVQRDRIEELLDRPIVFPQLPLEFAEFPMGICRLGGLGQSLGDRPVPGLDGRWPAIGSPQRLG